MSDIKEDGEFKQLLDADALPAQYHVVRCAVCGSMPELWEHKERGGTFSKVLMCPNGEEVCPDEHSINAGCPMFMPNMDFYKATRREAIDFWNKWNDAMGKQRRERLS
jgi:hypothetical protein